jgi:ATP-dependent helicase/nuclease subunit A
VVKSYRRADDATPETDIALDVAPVAHPSLPEWLRTSATSGQIVDRPLRPSDPTTSEGPSFRPAASIELRARALQRGTMVHRLLQSLPEVAAERRGEAALRYLARNADGWSEADRDALAAGVLALIEDKRFAAVFAQGSRAEVSIAGRLHRPGRPPALVSGQIDRLVVTEKEVLIVDFKTNHAPPSLPAEAPPGYVRQLALYRAVLQKLYPQRSVRTALLWTETPELMEISAPALDAQLATIIRGDDRA